MRAARSRSVLFGTLTPTDAGGDEAVEVAVEDRHRVARLVSGAKILHELLTVEEVRTHLVAPAGGDVAREFLLLRCFLLLLQQEEAGLQHAHGCGAVLD